MPSNCTLATIDVKSLYLNIPHDEGVLAVLNKLYYNNRKFDEIEIPPEAMKDFLNIVLTKNYFYFVGKMFHQIQGTAMGIKMAPANAKIFMADLEEKRIEDYHITPTVWKRYIDDVFCIWPGQPQDFENFVAYLNTKHRSIKFTYECSASSVDFLDLTVYKGHRYSCVNNTLDIKPFYKKNNKF